MTNQHKFESLAVRQHVIQQIASYLQALERRLCNGSHQFACDINKMRSAYDLIEKAVSCPKRLAEGASSG